jgi:hypothetical protein
MLQKFKFQINKKKEICPSFSDMGCFIVLNIVEALTTSNSAEQKAATF